MFQENDETLTEYCEATELTTAEIELLCQDLEELRDINTEFITMLAQQETSINAIGASINQSEARVDSSVRELHSANSYYNSYMRYRLVIGVSLGALVAGPVGCILGAKAATGAFVFTSLLGSLF